MINNARCFRKIREEHGSFSDWLWKFSGGKTILYIGHETGKGAVSNGLSDEIAKELKKAEGQAAGMKAKLSNEAFLSKAPEQVVAAEREKARKLDALVENLRESEAKLRALR